MMNTIFVGLIIVFCSVFWLNSQRVYAHCDSMDGPVVTIAKIALEKGDVTPILKWVKPDYEPEIRELFQKTLIVRNKGPEAQELADRYFFETLVRLHRAGEGASYTGLLPAGQQEPIVIAADKAIESNSVDNLIKEVTEKVTDGIRERFNRALEKRKQVDESVEAGREYVENYVTFIHYVEKIFESAVSSAVHHEE